MKKGRDIFDEVSDSSGSGDVFEQVSVLAGGGDIFDRIAGESRAVVSPSRKPPKYLPSLDGYRPGKINLREEREPRPRPGDHAKALKETDAFDRDYPSLSGYEPPEDLISYLDTQPRSPAQLQANAERMGPDPMAFGSGFVKGAARGITGGVYDPTIYASEQPGATMGQFAGGAAPAAVAPFAPALVPMFMAGQGFLNSATEQASRPGGLVEGLNPLETGSREFSGGLLGALPAAVGLNLPTRLASGAALGGAPAAAQEAISQYARNGEIDFKDPETIQNILLQSATGAAFGLIPGGPQRLRDLIEYRPPIPDQARRIEIRPQNGQTMADLIQPGSSTRPEPMPPREAFPAPEVREPTIRQPQPEAARSDIFGAITAREPQDAPRMADPSQITPEAKSEAPAPSQPARADIFERAPAPAAQAPGLLQPRLLGEAPAGEAAKVEPPGPRTMPRDNYSKPLSQYTPRLYRETNIDRAMEFIPHGTETMTDWGTYHFAEVPEMARGQGDNRGILLEFDAGAIKGRINLDKPGLDFAFQNRQGEFVAAGNSQNVYRKALRGFTVFPDAKGGLSYTHRLRHIGNRIVKEGWTRTKNPDGSLTYTRPQAQNSTPAAAPEAPAPIAQGAPEVSAAPQAPEAKPAPAAPSQTGLDLKGAGRAIADNYYIRLQEELSTGKTQRAKGIADQFAERAYQRGYTELEEIRRAAEAGQAIKDQGLKGPELNRTLLETLDRDFPAQAERAPFVTPEAPITPAPPNPAPGTPAPPSRGAEPPGAASQAAEGPGMRERSFPKTLEKNDLPGGDNRTYEVKGNAQSIERATREIEAAGMDKSIEDVLAEVKPSAEHTTKGILLIKRLQEAGDKLKVSNPQEAEANFAKAVRVASDLSQKLTEQGQAIQAASIVSRLSPDGIVLFAQRQIQKANAERLFPGKTPETSMTPAQALQLRDAAKKVQELEGYLDDSKRVAKIVDKAGKNETLSPEDVIALQDYKTRLQTLIGEDLKPAARSTPVTPVETPAAPRRPGIPGQAKKKSLADTLIEALDKKEQAARARLKARGYRLYSGIPLDDLADFAIIGASRLAKGGIRFTEWGASMTKDFGEEVRPHLSKIYAKAQDVFNQERARASKLAANARAIHATLNKIDTNTSLGADQAKALGEMVEQIQTLSGDAKIEASQELQAALQALSRPSLGQKVSSAQTIGQLLNPKTAVRNIIGNEIFFRMERLSKLVATPIDMARSKITGTEREITFRTEGQGEYWKNFMRGARAAWKGVNPEGIQSKYDLHPAAFTGKGNPLTYMERALGVELKAFDYASYMRAKNQTLGELASLRADQFKIPKAQRDAFVKKWIAEADENIVQMADDYGKYVTFQDETGLSNAAQGVKTALNKATYLWQVQNPRFGLGDMVLKYPKTPANIFLRALDYSPAGFIRSAYLIAEPILKGGPRNVREIEMSLARAITGTVGFTGMGYYLADKGVISGRHEKDRDARAFRQEQTGERNYQVNLSALERWVKSGFKEAQLKKEPRDLLASYDWAQPVSQSIAAAATLKQDMEHQKDPMHGAANIAAAGFEAGLESLAEQPLLQGLSDLFGGGPNSTAAERMTRILEGVPASFVPGLLNQIRQATGNQVPETYSPNPAQRALNKVTAKIPFVAKTLPEAYKTLGDSPRELYQGGANSLFNVFLNPSFVAKYNLDPVVEAVLTPYEAEGRTRQFPQAAKRTLKYTDMEGNPKTMDLEGRDVSKLQSLMGFETGKAFHGLKPADLQHLTYEEQEAALAKLVNQSASHARDRFLQERGIPYMNRDMKRAYQASKR